MSRRGSGPVERLTSRQLAELSSATLGSARRLFDDAKLLYDAGRYPSSFVLLGLSADELGKHVMVTAFCAAREDTDAEWEKFWVRFRRHEAKLDVALYGAWFEDLLDLGGPITGREFHKRRLGATYVDLNPVDRSIVTPEELASAEVAKAALLQVGRYLASCESVMAQTDVDRLTEVFEKTRNEPKPTRDTRTTVAEAMGSRDGLSAADIERLLRLTQDLSDESATAPGDDSGLFAKIAARVLGIRITPAEASKMLGIVEQMKAARDDAEP